MGHVVSPASEKASVDHDARWGVLQCLRMLMEEAYALELTETAQALERALALGHSESGLHRHLRSVMAH